MRTILEEMNTLQYVGDLQKNLERAYDILELITDCCYHEPTFVNNGIKAVKELLKGETEKADKFDEKYKLVEWEGYYPPTPLVFEYQAKQMYMSRKDSIKYRELLEVPCHICKGTNTVDLPVETDKNETRVSYVACIDCQMLIGDC